MALRSHHELLVVDFLARGGTIRKLPPPKPTLATDVLQYLRDRNVEVEAVPQSDGGEAMYLYKARIINLKTLVAIANRHRSRRRLPPFQLALRVQ